MMPLAVDETNVLRMIHTSLILYYLWHDGRAHLPALHLLAAVIGFTHLRTRPLLQVTYIRGASRCTQAEIVARKTAGLDAESRRGAARELHTVAGAQTRFVSTTVSFQT